MSLTLIIILYFIVVLLLLHYNYVIPVNNLGFEYCCRCATPLSLIRCKEWKKKKIKLRKHEIRSSESGKSKMCEKQNISFAVMNRYAISGTIILCQHHAFFISSIDTINLSCHELANLWRQFFLRFRHLLFLFFFFLKIIYWKRWNNYLSPIRDLFIVYFLYMPELR